MRTDREIDRAIELCEMSHKGMMLMGLIAHAAVMAGVIDALKWSKNVPSGLDNVLLKMESEIKSAMAVNN